MANKNEIIPWGSECKTFRLFDLLGKKWVIFLIYLLDQEFHSFNNLLKKLPLMSSKVLSERLKYLQEQWMVRKEITSISPVKINYHLTPLWKKISKKIADFAVLVQ